MLWVLYGYSMAFGNDIGGGLLGNPTEFFGLKGLMSEKSLVFTIPSLAFVGFQAVFAIITVALISGAIADRARFGPWLLFAGVWAPSSTSRSRTGCSPSTEAQRLSVAGSPTT